MLSYDIYISLWNPAYRQITHFDASLSQMPYYMYITQALSFLIQSLLTLTLYNRDVKFHWSVLSYCTGKFYLTTCFIFLFFVAHFCVLLYNSFLYTHCSETCRIDNHYVNHNFGTKHYSDSKFTSLFYHFFLLIAKQVISEKVFLPVIFGHNS